MNEILVLGSNKESCGMGVIDVATGSIACTSFKNCIADARTMCSIGSSSSSFSGQGSSGDYLAVAQSKKPVIHIWQWGKPQPAFQCHIQEIITSLASDSTGTFLFGGTRKGWIYCWNVTTGELINIWQAHFKTVTKIQITKNGQFCISASEDGMARAWDLSKVLDVAERMRNVGNNKQSITPYKTWSAHTLAVKDFYVIDAPGLLRVATCSLDRTVVIYDVHAGKQIVRISLPHSLESIISNPGEDVLCVGSTEGTIFVIDLAVTAISISASQALIASLSGSSMSTAQYVGTTTTNLLAGRPAPSTLSAGGLPAGTGTLEGHTKAVTSLCFSADNTTLVSGSEDGTVRMWDVWTRQCTRECRPLNKCSITNALLLSRPEALGTGVVKPSLCPVAHLKKYTETANVLGTTVDGSGNPIVVLGPALMRNSDANRDGSQGMSHLQVLQERRKQAVFLASKPATGNASEQEVVNAVANTTSAAVKRKRGGEAEEHVAPAAKQQQQEEEDEQEKDDGFLSFSAVAAEAEHADDVEEDAKDDESDGSSSSDQDDAQAELQEKLRAAHEAIANLQRDNTRWMETCNQMKGLLANKAAGATAGAKQQAQPVAGGDDEDEEGDDAEEEEVAERDVGDAAEVVDRIRTAGSSGGKAKQQPPASSKAKNGKGKLSAAAASSSSSKEESAPAEWKTVGTKKRKLLPKVEQAAMAARQEIGLHEG